MRIWALFPPLAVLPAVWGQTDSDCVSVETLKTECETNTQSFTYTPADRPASGIQFFCWKVDCAGQVDFDYNSFSTFCKKTDIDNYTYQCPLRTECDRLTLATIDPDENQPIKNTGCLSAQPYPCGHPKQTAVSCVKDQTKALGLTVLLELRGLVDAPIDPAIKSATISINYSCPAKCPTPAPPPPPIKLEADFGDAGTVTFSQDIGSVDTMITGAFQPNTLPPGPWYAIYEYPHAGWAPPGGSTWADCDNDSLGNIYNWSVTDSGWLGTVGPSFRRQVPVKGARSVAGRSLVVGGDNGTWKCALIGHSSPAVAAGKATFSHGLSLTLTLNGPGGDATAMLERSDARAGEYISIVPPPATCVGGELQKTPTGAWSPVDGWDLSAGVERRFVTAPGDSLPSWLQLSMLVGGVVVSRTDDTTPILSGASCATLWGEDECTTVPCTANYSCFDPDRGSRKNYLCFCLSGECSNCQINSSSVGIVLPPNSTAGIGGEWQSEFKVVVKATDGEAVRGTIPIRDFRTSSNAEGKQMNFSVGIVPACSPLNVNAGEDPDDWVMPLSIALCVLCVLLMLTVLATYFAKRRLKGLEQELQSQKSSGNKGQQLRLKECEEKLIDNMHLANQDTKRRDQTRVDFIAKQKEHEQRLEELNFVLNQLSAEPDTGGQQEMRELKEGVEACSTRQRLLASELARVMPEL
eukprot:Hpha_TRINITY_DN2443_c0_g1::TRINITY_DN2443_c0_g1_i1::g.24496::m.24496